MTKVRILGDLIRFLWGRKQFWLIPIVVFLGVLGALIVAAKGSVIAPFIYTLF